MAATQHPLGSAPANPLDRMHPSAACPHSRATPPLTGIPEPTDRKLPRGSHGAAPNAISRDALGVWHVHDMATARALLRNADVAQAGFRAEDVLKAKAVINPPFLYLEGEAHREQRRRFAHLFSPRIVDTRYQESLVRLADELVDQVRRDQQVDVSALAAAMSAQAVGRIIGVSSRRPKKLTRRIDRFFAPKSLQPGGRLRTVLNVVHGNLPVLAFFLWDIWPAIREHRKAPADDMISHLLGQGRSSIEILTECVTVAAAGIVTTREFISLATWQLLSRPALADRYRSGSDRERAAILREILRLDPVVGHLLRRATADIEVGDDAERHRIPAGALISIHIHDVNANPATVSEEPMLLRPDRDITDHRVQPDVLSFGDGHHRCIGTYIAILETDILLNRLLRVPGLRIVQPPRLGWNEIADSYELRDFLLAAR